MKLIKNGEVYAPEYLGKKEIAPSGWFGPFDPKEATVELGQGALDLSVEYVRGFIDEFRKIN